MIDKSTSPRPSTHGGDGGKRGRDANGRFATGNKLGQGNPLAGRAAKLRSELLRSVSEGDVKAVVKGLLAAARGGDVPAAKLVLAYTVGQPEAMDVAQRLDELESRLNLRGTSR